MFGHDVAVGRRGGEVNDVAEQILIADRHIGGDGQHQPGVSLVQRVVETFQHRAVQVGEIRWPVEDKTRALLDRFPAGGIRADPFGQPGQVQGTVQMEQRARAQVQEHPDGHALLPASGRPPEDHCAPLQEFSTCFLESVGGGESVADRLDQPRESGCSRSRCVPSTR